jgi:hypothetical protein
MRFIFEEIPRFRQVPPLRVTKRFIPCSPLLNQCATGFITALGFACRYLWRRNLHLTVYDRDRSLSKFSNSRRRCSRTHSSRTNLLVGPEVMCVTILSGKSLVVIKGLLYGLSESGSHASLVKPDAPWRSRMNACISDTLAMHRSGVTLYYACSNAQLYQTDRSHMLGVLGKTGSSALLGGGEQFFDHAVHALQATSLKRPLCRNIDTG